MRREVSVVVGSIDLPGAVAELNLLGDHRGVLLLVPVGAHIALSAGDQRVELELPEAYWNQFLDTEVDALRLYAATNQY